MKNYIFEPKTRFFIRFLKEKGIFSSFKKEVGLQIRRNKHNKLNTSYNGSIVKLFNAESPTWYVDSSLIWKDTKQGEHFWRHVEAEFDEYYKNEFFKWCKKYGKPSTEKA